MVKLTTNKNIYKGFSIFEAYKKKLITKSECAELLEIKGFDTIYQLLKCDLLNSSFIKQNR